VFCAEDKFKFGTKLISGSFYVSGPEWFLFLYFKYWYFRSLKRFWDCGVWQEIIWHCCQNDRLFQNKWPKRPTHATYALNTWSSILQFVHNLFWSKLKWNECTPWSNMHQNQLISGTHKVSYFFYATTKILWLFFNQIWTS
jgi:hypothetical protein